MNATWTTVHPNPDALSLAGTLPGEEEAMQYRGLELVPLYDFEDQMVWYDTWELRLAKTGEPLMHVRAHGHKAALSWATRVADLALWETFEARPNWHGAQIGTDLRNLISANPETFSTPICPFGMTVEESLVSAKDDLDRLVPYG